MCDVHKGRRWSSKTPAGWDSWRLLRSPCKDGNLVTTQCFVSQHVQTRCFDNWPLKKSIFGMCVGAAAPITSDCSSNNLNKPASGEAACYTQ